MTEHGLDVSHDEIAREAGVAVGTVYRRYPRKDQLFETVFVDRVDAVVALAEEALTADDAWEGFAARHVETELWRRVLAVIIDGISTGPPTARLPGNPPPPEALAAILSGAPIQRP